MGEAGTADFLLRLRFGRQATPLVKGTHHRERNEQDRSFCVGEADDREAGVLEQGPKRRSGMGNGARSWLSTE